MEEVESAQRRCVGGENWCFDLNARIDNGEKSASLKSLKNYADLSEIGTYAGLNPIQVRVGGRTLSILQVFPGHLQNGSQ